MKAGNKTESETNHHRNDLQEVSTDHMIGHVHIIIASEEWKNCWTLHVCVCVCVSERKRQECLFPLSSTKMH